MRLFLTRRFQQRYEDLPKEAKPRVRDALVEIGRNPRGGKKLSGELEGHYSWRVGRYRILYTVLSEGIFAETVRHRKDVYRERQPPPLPCRRGRSFGDSEPARPSAPAAPSFLRFRRPACEPAGPGAVSGATYLKRGNVVFRATPAMPQSESAPSRLAPAIPAVPSP